MTMPDLPAPPTPDEIADFAARLEEWGSGLGERDQELLDLILTAASAGVLQAELVGPGLAEVVGFGLRHGPRFGGPVQSVLETFPRPVVGDR
jgi:hypothetical protein